MKYFRVKYGYGKDEFYSVDETEVPKAIKAQVDGSVFICSEGTIAGNNIMAVQPDYNRLLGFNRDYQLTGEDYQEIEHRHQREHLELITEAKQSLIGSPLKQLS